MKRLSILFTLFIAGCTTVEFVRKDVAPAKQGILRHAPPSTPERETEYRQKANQMAREFCGGDFKIIREYQALDQARSTAGIGTGFGLGHRSSILIGGTGPRETMYNFVEFSCQ